MLISARIYGFSRSQKEILAVVRVCDMTLRKRLEEFSRTPSSKLTPEEFHGVWLEEEIDPPSFVTAPSIRKKDRIKNEQARSSEERLAYILGMMICLFFVSTIFQLYLFSKTFLGIDSRLLVEDPILDLSILDTDQEVTNALLEEAEREAKSILWHEANKEYLQQQDGNLIISALFTH